MVKARKTEEGSALLYIFLLCLFLSAAVFFLTEQNKLNRLLDHRLEQELILSQMAEDLTGLALAHVLRNGEGYDAPRHFVFPAGQIQELAQGYAAQVEIRDEGSCLNPNHLPVADWQTFFRSRPQVYERLVSWFFPPDEVSGRVATPVRSRYLLTPDELASLISGPDGKLSSSFASRLTVFGPANYYLIDGEVFVSLLQRTGLQLSSLAVETIIEQFNAQRGQVYSDNLDTLLSQLQLPEHPPLERLERVLTTKGTINPNFVEADYLRLLLPAEERREFADLQNRQQEQPFTSLADFEDYLRNTHRVNLSAERLRHLFTVQSKILGIKVTIFDQEKTNLLLTVETVVRRGTAGEDGAYTVLYRRKKWGAEKEERND